ncbi:MAG: hypothetical protein DRP37_05605 [Thermodesulfobacteriota bacterium]|nr:MAG: hypothetical protein DRP37_05605 [Thermodesulfobacteriota bacterium]
MKLEIRNWEKHKNVDALPNFKFLISSFDIGIQFDSIIHIFLKKCKLVNEGRPFFQLSKTIYGYYSMEKTVKISAQTLCILKASAYRDGKKPHSSPLTTQVALHDAGRHRGHIAHVHQHQFA